MECRIMASHIRHVSGNHSDSCSLHPALARAVARYVSRWTRHPARSPPLLQGGCLDHILGTWMTELAHQTDPGVTQKLFDKNRMVNTMSLHGYNYDNLRTDM